jgi:hypothetical protein
MVTQNKMYSIKLSEKTPLETSTNSMIRAEIWFYTIEVPLILDALFSGVTTTSLPPLPPLLVGGTTGGSQ